MATPGGTFAPPVTDERVRDWPGLIAGTVGITRIALEGLFRLLTVHRPHRRASLVGSPHPSGRGTIMPLADHVLEEINPVLPSSDDRAVYSQLFDALQGPTRDMAYHLLWYANELALGREPTTNDMI